MFQEDHHQVTNSDPLIEQSLPELKASLKHP